MKKILINKTEKKLRLVENEQVVLELNCWVGEKEGRKLQKDDLKTPEGKYFIIVKNPKSDFYLSLGLNYPNVNDAQEAFNQNIIDKKIKDEIILAQENYLKNSKTMIPWNTQTGGAIYIHGEGENEKEFTKGCIKLLNSDMKKVFNWAEIGTQVVIS